MNLRPRANGPPYFEFLFIRRSRWLRCKIFGLTENWAISDFNFRIYRNRSSYLFEDVRRGTILEQLIYAALVNTYIHVLIAYYRKGVRFQVPGERSKPNRY